MQHDSAGEAEAAGHSSVMRWVQQGRGEAAGTAECNRAVEKGSVRQDENAAECSQEGSTLGGAAGCSWMQ